MRARPQGKKRMRKTRLPAAGPNSPPGLPGAYRKPRRVADGWRVHWYAWRDPAAPKIGEYAGPTREACDAAARADSVRLTAILDDEDLRRSHGWSKSEGGAPHKYVDAATVIAMRRRKK